MPDWSIWLIVAAVFAVGEMVMFTGFILGPLAIGAAITAIVAAAGGSQELQVASFFVLTVLSLLFLRPIAKRHLSEPPEIRTGVDALIGQRATVVQAIAADELGLVKIGGETWTARALRDGVAIDTGTKVTVDGISGATALVSPITQQEEAQ